MVDDLELPTHSAVEQLMFQQDPHYISPTISQVLEVNGVTAEYYAMQWFLTLFASDLPQRTVHRIWAGPSANAAGANCNVEPLHG